MLITRTFSCSKAFYIWMILPSSNISFVSTPCNSKVRTTPNFSSMTTHMYIVCMYIYTHTHICVYRLYIYICMNNYYHICVCNLKYKSILSTLSHCISLKYLIVDGTKKVTYSKSEFPFTLLILQVKSNSLLYIIL